MNIPKLFTKVSSSKKKDSGTPPSSPEKRASPTKPAKRGSVGGRSPTKSGSRAQSFDRESHPLNLPPEELRRLSVLSAMSNRSSSEQAPTPMDIDRESTASPAQSQPQPPSSPPAEGSASSASQKINGDSNGNKTEEDAAPPPPPHKVPTSPPPIDPEACKAAGNKFFKAREWQKAINEYSKAIDAAPSNPTYRSNRAAALMSAGQYAAALEDCKVADELNPDDPKILHRLARIYTFLGRPGEALDVYTRIQPSATATDKAPALMMQQHIQQAEAALKDGTSGSMVIHALDQAEKGLGNLVETPRKWKLLRGEGYLKMGNVNSLGDAQTVAMSLLRSNSNDPEALVLRGRILYAQGENDKAVQHFRQALSCDPDFKDAVKWLRMVQKLDRMKEEGNNYFKSSRFQQAVDTYTQALEVDPANKGTNSKILQNRALCYIKLKQYQPAISDCDRALTLDPSYMKARKTRAKALGEAGDWEEAIREFKAIQDANPSEPGIAKDIRNAELELKKSKRKDYYKILGIEKDADENQIKRAYRKLAIIHHPDKNPDDPDAAERFKDIGEAYETLSDPQKRARYDSGEDLIDPADMFGGGMGGMGGGMGGMNISPEMLFNMMNGGGGGGGGFSFGGHGGHPFGNARGGRGQGGFQGGFPF